MKLTIISHTEHYKLADGTIVGWGPTITEINHLAEVFDEIYHIAMFHDCEAPKSSLPYSTARIKFIPLKPTGGQGVKEKLKVLFSAPSVIRTVNQVLAKTDCFQLRAPTGIGVFLIPYLTLFSKKKGWFKYAGNWKQHPAPLGYAAQRYMLKRQSRPVTINGAWENQEAHCLSFENPCLVDSDIKEGFIVRTKKEKGELINFCYVGRLEKQKGVERIIKAFGQLNEEVLEMVGKVHLVGDGHDIDYFKGLSLKTGVDFVFHGFLPTSDVFKIYKQSHFFLMPTTASEGFPKVLAEAMNFGCIPMVSAISSIGQYVKDKRNGFLIQSVTEEETRSTIITGLGLTNEEYKIMLSNQSELVKRFTYGYYVNRIKGLMIV
ncbi:glycosyltransferase [Xanthomarina sp.]|uniref:glycosyltransferase n=1 Tax=Xanthomarina sp. TaxID=1931211 RepID=UPI002CBE4C9E|nr:glycosyltransferase [Xanthomarina sp.]HLV40395.1 glycosyltransferase [Xanthomarina sp.]